MEAYGVWSDLAGGVVATGSSSAEAEAERVLLVNGGEDAEDLKVIPLCPDHWEEPLDGCEQCAADGDE